MGASCCPHSLFNEIITYSNFGSLHVVWKHRKEIFASERWNVWIILCKKLDRNFPFIPVTFIFHIYYFIISSSAGEVTDCEPYGQTVFCSRARYIIILRVPLAFCLVCAIPLYMMVKRVENDDGHWCSTWRYICCVPDLFFFFFLCVHAGADRIIVLTTT